MRRLPILLVVLLASCGAPPSVRDFAGTLPTLDPVVFFTGHVRSWGVMERSGAPASVVITDCTGEIDGDSLRMTQVLQIGDDPPVTRQWRMRRNGPGRFAAVANDMVGTAEGEAAGRAFHWTWTLATSPGNPLRDVTMDQWWYLLDDGAMLNRTRIRKLGVTLAEVTEHFVRR